MAVARPRTTWLSWLVLGSVAIGVYVAEPSPAVGTGIYFALAFGSTGIVIGGALRRHRRPLLPWLALGAGIALLALGDVAWELLAVEGELPEPSPADAFYLAGSLAIALAMAALLLRRSHPLPGFLDALVIGTALGVLLWVLAVEPRLDAEALPLPALLTVAAYPTFDVVMLAIVAVALGAGGSLDRSTGLLAAAIFATLASDLAYAAMADAPQAAAIIDAGWLLAYVLWGAAALVPPDRRFVDLRRPHARPSWSFLRPYFLLASAATPLVVALVHEPREDGRGALAAAVASVVMALLVIVRLELVVRQQARLLDERHRLQSTLVRQATEDPLTELPNRRGLAEKLVLALADRARPPALMVLDLDDFKAVNDTLGHPVGDSLLREVAERLRATVRASDTVARLGGDEFAIVLAPCPSAEVAGAMAERLLRSLDEPVLADRGGLSIGGSIGIALAEGEDASVESLLRDADIALYRAKSAGKHRWEVLDAESSAAAVRTMSIPGELGRALTERELVLHFQPIVSLADGTIAAFEALLRWDHPRLGPLLPADFLATAERSAHMAGIGRWVLEEACTTASSWQHGRSRGVGVNVNVWPAQLVDNAFADIVLEVLRDSGLPARLLTLEILETALDTTLEPSPCLLRLRDAGVHLAIDDFGMGSSSLSRVSEIPASQLKLDRSLVAGGADPRIVKAIVRLGQALGVRLVAEGIETAAELERVRDYGCDAAQGYWLGRPVPASEVAQSLAGWAADTLPAPEPPTSLTLAAPS